MTSKEGLVGLLAVLTTVLFFFFFFLSLVKEKKEDFSSLLGWVAHRKGQRGSCASFFAWVVPAPASLADIFGRHSRLPQFLQTSSLPLSETTSVLGQNSFSFFFSHPSCCISISFFFSLFPFSLCAPSPSFEVPRNHHIMMGEGKERERKRR